jgi:hypothetical protein
MNYHFSPFVQKALVCLFVSFLSMQLLWAQKSYTSVCSVHFVTDKYYLTADATQLLDSFIKQVNLSTDYLIEIEANTDADGSTQYNDNLSINRATSVRDYLLQKGIITTKARTKWNGELKPKFTNETDDGKAGNRRVDLKTTLYKFENIADVFASISENKNQLFAINASKQNKIKAVNGTEISIPADAFTFEDGTIAKGKIEFTVKEALQTDDILLTGLTTVSDGKLLQTGGMVYIEASINGKKLKIANDKNIEISMPAKKMVAGMELFYGEKTKSGSVNWKPTGQQPKGIELNVDKSALRKSRLKEVPITIPKLNYASQPMQPIKPAMPYKPYNPKEPKYISFKPNWWQKIIYSDEKKMEKELAMNNPKQAEFDKRIDNYDKAMLKYAAHLKKYNEVQLPKYSKDDDAYREELSNRAEAINKCFINYSKKIATKYINQRIDAYLKKPITNRTKLNLSNFKFNADYFNPYDFVYQVIGKQNIQPETMKSDIMMDAAFRLYDAYGNYFYPPNLVLRDGSIIYTNINSLVNQQILKIIDSSGLNNLMDDYNKKILEASAKAGALDNSQLNSYGYRKNKSRFKRATQAYLQRVYSGANERAIEKN